MKSALLFAGIGLSAILLAACENQDQEKVEDKAEQSLTIQKGQNAGGTNQDTNLKNNKVDGTTNSNNGTKQ